jgi:maleylpyruvate isomerase
VGRPTVEIDGCRASHARVVRALSGLTDEMARRPSLLPDWTVGHVLTHIARNADSVVRRLDAAERGELVPQYPGGGAQRSGDIEAGAGRRAAELVDDVATASAAVDARFAAVADEVWDRPTLGFGSGEQPARHMALSRWREVEVHHVDLGLGYLAADWPRELIDLWLPSVVVGLPPRTDPNALLAWALGRGPVPDLDSWG